MTDGPRQLPLGIRLDDEANLDNYLISAANQELLDNLLLAEGGQQLNYIRSSGGAGLTHLLQALCHVENLARRPSLYLPLGAREQFRPEMLEGIAALSLVCLDEVELIAGDEAWERALFNALNDLLASETRLVIGAAAAPSELGLSLADLTSRLQLAPVFRLHPLGDEDKLRMLQLRAARRGLRLEERVASYIMQRTSRSLGDLLAVLDRLDASSLTHQRPLTVPLVRDTMGW